MLRSCLSWASASGGDGVELSVVNPARATPDDYIDFLLATPKVASATEAARVQPERPRPPAHDAFTRLLSPRIVATNGDTEHWITNDLGMDEVSRLSYAEQAWGIEEYHRGLKQCTEVERCPARLARSQRNPIGLAIRAFVRLEWHRFHTEVSWIEAKSNVI